MIMALPLSAPAQSKMTKRAATPGLWFARQEHHLRPITAEALWSPPLANSSPKKRDNRKDATARDSKAVIISNSQVFTPRPSAQRRQSPRACGACAAQQAVVQVLCVGAKPAQ